MKYESSGKRFLFAGPTLSGLSKSLLDSTAINVRPPAIRGDIETLVNQNQHAGTIILADGRFHQDLSVGHAELRRAIQAGWTVWGVSSMGAIRACEMRLLGMKGFGKVYDFFVNDPHFSDDEVALLHGPPPLYMALSEPLVHIRMLLKHLVDTEVLRCGEVSIILHLLKNRWFGFRTLDLLSQLMMEHCALSRQRVSELLDTIDEFRIKSSDLADLLIQIRSSD